MEKLKVGLFIDSFYPMVDGVVQVVDQYAKRLSEFCDVTVFTTKPRKNNAILLIILILWNIFLTYQVIQNNSPFPRFTDSENEIIMQLEEIPFEVIGE